MINNNGPQLGETPKPMTLMSLNQGEITLGGAQAKSTLVLFVAPSCPICKVLLPLINSLQKAESSWLNVVLASDGDEPAQRALIAQHKLENIPYVLSQDWAWPTAWQNCRSLSSWMSRDRSCQKV
ncbi:hypothetical protein [Vibrio fluvialis]|uniref:hypothetical protein n=1 Tax=Vibrio fluvialis TaxID=676 RepID=UPI001ED9312E|nr:hypothetical protein [Vibrio fluvialis]